MRVVTLDLDARETVLEFRGRIENVEPALEQIGAILARTSQRSFEEQRLGEIVWPPRYPNQSEPFVNVAGALADANEGGAVKSRRFDRRPALLDRGRLARSISWRTLPPNRVETGSDLEYAPIHQHGGKSSQTITQTAKKVLAKFLKTSKGKPYRDKLGWLVNKMFHVLETEVARRPFVGITEQDEDEIRDVVERHVAGEL